uniref:Uncharacterized protein n=1 Tax=Pseudo-nitzschia australis TaxID=44445 RepID=A0A7S4AII6_9STRA|mmetsp:Transcript_11765/g.24881  ORF Transcript_11765/g.24881 Transcript_11765/m.24881 type:complete len:701 (-) Transcript_11765:80-2182(-)
MGRRTNPSAAKEGQPEPRRELQKVVFTTVAIAAVFIILSVVSESQSFSAKANHAQVRTTGGGKANEKANGICLNICEKRHQKRAEIFQGDLFDPNDLLKLASTEKGRLLDKLRKDYGKYFDPIFVDKENGGYRPCSGVTKDGQSFERLKRKLMIKILSMQLKVRQHDSDSSGCDCSIAEGKALRNDIEETDDPSLLFKGIDATPFYEKYVWATGGHSAAAAHGNLFNESYTAYMEGDIKDAFASIGIEFEGRNYAMGGTPSATDVSMCWEQIFGQDVDFFSWDYGMTDGNDPVKLFHYSYRGGVSKNRPAAMIIHYNGRAARNRLGAFQTLEEMGMPTFHANEESMTTMRDAFPDSSGFSTIEEINTLPEYVRNYKCGTSIEKGDPYCGSDKFTKWGCEKRMKQTSWHPGFKEHAIAGHGIALFLIDALLSSLQDLIEHDNGEAGTLLSQLEEEEKDLHSNFINAKLPDLHRNLFSNLDKLALSEGESKIDPSLFFKGKSICHTARLPSRTRYQGILTDTDKIGQQAPVGEETYYLGFDKVKATKTATENEEIRLVFDMNKEREDKCAGVIVKPDYPDSFYINSLDGWAKLSFPNEAEKKAYGYDPAQFEGIVIIHGKVCDWGKCPQGFLKPEEDHAEEHWEMKINDQFVTTVKDIGNGAAIVGGENGFRFQPNSNDRYDIEIKVNKEGHYFQLVNFVLY